MPYKFSVLASGSKGNCSVHDPMGDSRCFLVDVGLPGNRIDFGLAVVNRSMDMIHEVIITHEHGDHLPKSKAGCGYNMPGEHVYAVTPCTIERVPMVHDTPCDALVIESDDGIKVVHVTDTAEVPKISLKRMKNPSGIIIEANWDDYLITENLKDSRIPDCVLERSIDTHLSNAAMANVLEQLMWPGLEVVVLIHLSSANNSPVLARQAAEEVLERGGLLKGKGDGQCRVIVSEQDKPTELIILRGNHGQ